MAKNAISVRKCVQALRVKRQASNDKNRHKRGRVAAVVKEDCLVGRQMIEEKAGIPKTTMQGILHKNLKKQKIYARFVPHVLTAKQYNLRVAHMCDMLEMVKNDLKFVNWIIMGDESWCSAYDPETKHQSAS